MIGLGSDKKQVALEKLDQDQNIDIPRVSTTVDLRPTLALKRCEQTFWRKLTALQRWTFKIVFERKKNMSSFAIPCFLVAIWSQLSQAGFHFNFFQGGFHCQFFRLVFNFIFSSGRFSIATFSGRFSIGHNGVWEGALDHSAHLAAAEKRPNRLFWEGDWLRPQKSWQWGRILFESQFYLIWECSSDPCKFKHIEKTDNSLDPYEVGDGRQKTITILGSNEGTFCIRNYWNTLQKPPRNVDE